MSVVSQKSTITRLGAAWWLLMLCTVLITLGTTALGFWQLQRAAAKESVALQILENSQLPALESIDQKVIARATEGVAGLSKKNWLLHRSVRLRGTWLPEYTVFLDNRYMAGRPGFFVVTPLQLETTGSVIWVQRGWVARDPVYRARLPSLVLTEGVVTVKGRVVQEISRVYSLETEGDTLSSVNATANSSKNAGNISSTARGSRIWQNLPMVSFGPQIELLSLAILQTTDAEVAGKQDVLVRDWPQADSGVAKHYGYAFQWFALSVLILILYVWFQHVTPRRRTS